jgi:hypothetical protein
LTVLRRVAVCRIGLFAAPKGRPEQAIALSADNPSEWAGLKKGPRDRRLRPLGQNQHFVPRLLLKRFIPEVTPPGDKCGQLHVYTRDGAWLGQRTIDDIAAVEDAHSAELETEISRLEGRGGRALGEICAATPDVPGSGIGVEREYVQHLLTLTATISMRNPRHVAGVAQELGMDREAVETRWVREYVPKTTAFLMQLDWLVLVFRSPEWQVICSDAPALINYPRNYALTGAQYPLVNRGTMALLPISRSRILFGARDTERALPGVHHIYQTNALIIQNANEFIYPGIRDDDHIRTVIDYQKANLENVAKQSARRARKRLALKSRYLRKR